jgi:hypothetical protein
VLARDREYVLSMLSQLEAVFMNNRVSVIRNRTRRLRITDNACN